ncbi:hypothetical protein NPX13_g2787 [Xylaria arbuscula]|uniref:ADF-H domain-containing protein n=1 Tax=Xylaria arbuscula TaxID=114810 RepID=A0A9W8TQ06_9PEZI|nr:hypothetical protein NPX13_g2787 [Xylaria arbuscula]
MDLQRPFKATYDPAQASQGRDGRCGVPPEGGVRTTSQELVSQFNKLISDSSQFALLATISGESITTVTSIPRSSPDFNANLDSLKPYLKPEEPIYIFLRRHDHAPHLIAVTYVPDTAKVRQKMLFRLDTTGSGARARVRAFPRDHPRFHC